MKRIISFIILSCIVGTVQAQTAREEIYSNLLRSASNYFAYPDPTNVKPATPPKGYQPFYISTYARHGSRFLINPATYADPLAALKKADKAGKLTPKGKEALIKVDSISNLSVNRLGELTPLGARQHRGIATRMYENYPQIFAGAARINAQSSTIIRCILSMNAESLALQGLNPKLRFANDATDHDQFYLRGGDKELVKLRELPKAVAFREAIEKKYVHPDRLMKALFNDPEYVANYVHTKNLMNDLFEIACNMQSHDEQLDLYSLFTKEECYDLWQRDNLKWYVAYGPSPLTHSKIPYSQRALLQNILDVADTSVTKKENSATLRFGHESILMPFAALLELNDVGRASENTDSITDFWRNYKIFPMASNIQFVFFRSPNSPDILVKVLLNEHEARLPIPTNIAPFYKWKDVEAYYRKKLNDYQKEQDEVGV